MDFAWEILESVDCQATTDFAARIGGKPRVMPFTSVEQILGADHYEMAESNCYHNVNELVHFFGGERIDGYRIARLHNLLLTSDQHSLWKYKGHVFDITPSVNTRNGKVVPIKACVFIERPEAWQTNAKFFYRLTTQFAYRLKEIELLSRRQMYWERQGALFFIDLEGYRVPCNELAVKAVKCYSRIGALLDEIEAESKSHGAA